MPAVRLNQRSGALPAVSAFQLGLLRFVFFLFSPVLQFNLLALCNVCCPNASISLVLGLSFYPLEQAPNMVIYAMSKSGTATSGLIYLFGFFSPMHRHRRAPLLPKNSSAN